MTGTIAILDKLTTLCKQHKIQDGATTIACDNIAVVIALKEWSTLRVNPNQKFLTLLALA